MILLNKITRRKIKEHSEKDYPNECCGLIVERKRKPAVVECLNSANDKLNNFKISSIDYLRASEYGEIKALYHSHTQDDHSDNFTPLDLLNEGHGIEVILYLKNKNKFLISSEHNYLNKYLERDYKIGVTDCFTLIKDFYRENLNICFNDYDYDEVDFFTKSNWEDKHVSPFDYFYTKEGFLDVNYDDIKIHDIILFNDPKRYNNGYTNHLGMYVGNSTILHQPYNGVSELASFYGKHLKYVNGIIRHKTLF